MIRVIIERRAKEGKEDELLRELLDLRTQSMRQPGYVSGETLVWYDDPSLYVVISTWSAAAYWKTWTILVERRRIEDRLEPLLSAPEKTTVLNFLEAS